MSTQPDTGYGFDEELLVRLKGLVAEQGLDSEAGTDRGSTSAWRRSPRLLAGGAVALAAVLTALFVSAGGEGTSPAYAVEPRSNGEVSVQINELSDAKGIEAALGQAGIPADVTYLAAGMACSRSGLEAFPGRSLLSRRADANGVSNGPLAFNGPLTFEVSGHELGPDQTLVVTATAGSEETTIGGASLQLQVGTGKVAPCDPIPAA